MGNGAMLEKEIQSKAESYLNEFGLKFIHIPDSVLGHIAQHGASQVRNAVSRSLKGIPDLLIFSKSEKFNHCFMLELKTEKGTLRQGQINWHKGQNVVVTYGWDEARKAIDEFIKFIDKEEE